MLHAWVEYEVQKCLNQTHVRESREFYSADVDMVSVDSGEEIRYEDFLKDCERLPRTPVDECTKLDQQQLHELYLRHARFRIKALLVSLVPVLLSVYPVSTHESHGT
jgi:hypothetical protein